MRREFLALAFVLACSHSSSTAPNTAAGCDSPAGWPSSCNTGASGTLTDTTGDISLTTQGQVYSNVRINGSLTVLACDVTVRNVEVDAGIPYTCNSTPDVFPIWLKEPASCGVTLDHVSVITKASPNNYVTNAIRVAYGGPATIAYAKIIGTQLGITIGPGSVSDSYVLLGPTMRGDHNEDILETGGVTGLTIKHNTFLNPNLQTSALSLFTDFGANANFVVDHNLLAGGGYTCYCGDGVTARASDIVVTNNVFWEKYYPTVGSYGSGRAYNSAGGGTWAGNVFMGADGTLTTTAVPQPDIDQ